MRLGGDHDGVGGDAAAVGEAHAPAAAGPREPAHPLLEPYRARRQAVTEGAHELVHAVSEGDEQAPARAARAGRLPARATRAPERERDAPVAPLQLEKPGQRRGQAQRVGVGRVDAGDQRLGDPLERLPPEPAPHKVAEALVAAGAARQDKVERHPELAGPGEEPRAQKRPEAGGGQELEALRERMEPATEQHEDPAEAVVGPDEPVLEVEPPAERQRPRLLRQEGVGPGLDQEAVHVLGRDGAAEPRPRLDERRLDGRPALPCQLRRVVGGGQPADAAPDDDQPSHARVTKSASSSMNFG